MAVVEWLRERCDAMKRLSHHQLALLRECCRYSISEWSSKNQWYRLGGHGTVPLRYNQNTMQILHAKDLVEYKGYYTATYDGRKLVAELDAELEAKIGGQ